LNILNNNGTQWFLKVKLYFNMWYIYYVHVCGYMWIFSYTSVNILLFQLMNKSSELYMKIGLFGFCKGVFCNLVQKMQHALWNPEKSWKFISDLKSPGIMIQSDLQSILFHITGRVGILTFAYWDFLLVSRSQYC
jgi:hypothetical protein